MKAVILYSGGLDSMTLLGLANLDDYDELYTIGFDYGQKHDHYRLPSKKVKARYGIVESVLKPLYLLAPECSLVEEAIEVPKNKDPRAPGVPNTWVPARNLAFLAHAANYAAAKGAFDLFIGVNQLDYSGYPDCRGTFISAMELTIRVGVDPKFRIHTPLLRLTKAQILHRGLAIHVDYRETMSCYDPTQIGISCGACDACQLRLEAFKSVGLKDPIPYVTP